MIVYITSALEQEDNKPILYLVVYIMDIVAYKSYIIMVPSNG